MQQATPVGLAVLDRAHQRGITLGRVAAEVGVTQNTLSLHLWRPGHWPNLTTREGLARFLDRPITDVDALLREGGGRSEGIGRPRGPRIDVACAHCGKSLRRPRKQLKDGRHRSRRSFCDRECLNAWQQGRKPPPPLPTNGRRSGRHLLKAHRTQERPSDGAVAERRGVHKETVRTARNGRHKPHPVLRYALELEGVLPKQTRPPLTELVLSFCVEKGLLTLGAFAHHAGLTPTTVGRLVRYGRARRKTLRALSVVLGQSFTGLQIIGREVFPWDRPQSSRPRGRPPTFTAEQSREVCILRDMEGLSWPEIGRRMGWRPKMDRRGVACDCSMARRAYDAARVRLQPASP